MREIKFRYFDTKRQEFINDCDVYFIDSNCILAGDLDNPPVVDITNNVVVSQYTGLKDKNGREIYEGDIVSRHDGGIHFNENPLAEHIVKWGEFGWLPFNIGIGKARCVYGEIFDFIVIGNIYENQELLEEIK